MVEPKDRLCRLLAASTATYGINLEQDCAVMQQPWALTAGLKGGSVKCFSAGPKDINACYVAENEADGVILAFRGTVDDYDTWEGKLQGVLDWFNNVQGQQIETGQFPGKVHKGFWESTNSLWQAGILDAVKGAVQNSGGRPVYVTGYSKGGALAPLGAAMLVQNGVKVENVLMFEPPRVGDPAFRTWFNKQFPNAVRSEYQDDIVPHVPPVKGAVEAMTLDPTIKEILNKFFKDFSQWDYKAVGNLRFIEWDNIVVHGQSGPLFVKRLIKLAEALVRHPDKLFLDHMPCGAPAKGVGGSARQICVNPPC